jgi:uncharacterized protein YndB with AHSA1/START domain
MTTTGNATVTINQPPDQVWLAITDITRMGEWSPECLGGRWVDGASGPAVGAKFEGDNQIKLAGRTLKRWTTTSVVTNVEPNRCFEFLSEGYTTWRYDLSPSETGTQVTESFSYVSTGVQGFIYGKLLQRPRTIVRGMGKTLARLKSALEA